MPKPWAFIFIFPPPAPLGDDLLLVCLYAGLRRVLRNLEQKCKVAAKVKINKEVNISDPSFFSIGNRDPDCDVANPTPPPTFVAHFRELFFGIIGG